MQVVCEATQSQSMKVQVGAFECLVKIMTLYYQYMGIYMQQALFGVRGIPTISYVTLDDSRVLLCCGVIAHRFGHEEHRRDHCIAGHRVLVHSM